MKTKWLTCLVLLFASNAFSQGNFVYTNDNFTPNTVSAFKVNSEGSLTLLEDSPYLTGGTGGGSDIDAGKITTATAGKKSFLYAANVADATIAAFVINPQGHLIAIAGSPFVAGTPNSGANFSLAASPDGQFLFVTDDTTTVVHVFTIAGQSGAERKGLRCRGGGHRQEPGGGARAASTPRQDAQRNRSAGGLGRERS